MNYVTENITPAKAQEYLNSSQGNRPISKVTVRSYADTMKKGKWMMNGVPVVFDVDGHLLDGHHRLEAITLAGIPVKMDVCRGVSPDAFTTFDCGRHRNVGRCCRQNKSKKELRKPNGKPSGRVNTDHRYMGVRFYFESDDIWMKKIKGK